MEQVHLHGRGDAVRWRAHVGVVDVVAVRHARVGVRAVERVQPHRVVTLGREVAGSGGEPDRGLGELVVEVAGEVEAVGRGLLAVGPPGAGHVGVPRAGPSGRRSGIPRGTSSARTERGAWCRVPGSSPGWMALSSFTSENAVTDEPLRNVACLVSQPRLMKLTTLACRRWPRPGSCRRRGRHRCRCPCSVAVEHPPGGGVDDVLVGADGGLDVRRPPRSEALRGQEPHALSLVVVGPHGRGGGTAAACGHVRAAESALHVACCCGPRGGRAQPAGGGCRRRQPGEAGHRAALDRQHATVAGHPDRAGRSRRRSSRGPTGSRRGCAHPSGPRSRGGGGRSSGRQRSARVRPGGRSRSASRRCGPGPRSGW